MRVCVQVIHKYYAILYKRLVQKAPQRESCELFYLGQNKDYSPEDSLSDSSEKLLVRDEEEIYIYIWFG